MEIAGQSDRGLVRESNEDAILVADLDSGEVLDVSTGRVADGERGPLLVLCDGMGGSAGGDIASSMACRCICDVMLGSPLTSDRSVLARNLRRAVRHANQQVVAAAAADKKLQGMGTTVSAAALVANTVVLAQVGDSRAYVLRGQRLSQITRDQSVVSALVQSGQLSEERAAYSMQRGRILQAVGSDADVEVSLSIAELRAGDRIVLCSDGLYEMLDHEAISRACAIARIDEATHALIAEAKAKGGTDNISVLLAEVTGAPLRDPVAGEDELRFTELDPAQEGASALSTTSMVGRRLAHRAGLRDAPWPQALPATSQHPIMPEEAVIGPAERALANQSGGSPAIWVAVLGIPVALGLLYALGLL